MGHMAHRLHHDVEVAQRATLGIAVGIVLAAFLISVIASTVYDIVGFMAD